MIRIACRLLYWSLAACSALAQVVDSDNDGLPDIWESAAGLNAASGGDALGDPDGDGVVNLLEYVWGGDPNRADPAIKPSAGILNGQFFTLTFRQRISASNFVFQAEHSLSISGSPWLSGGFSEVARGISNPDIERVTLRLETPLSGAARQFVRLSVRRPSSPATPTFVYHVIDDTIVHGQGLSIADIDRDQDQDVIAALSLTDSVYLYVNGASATGGGRGTNWSTVKIAPDNSIVAMQTAVADFDADGALDIAAVGLFDRDCTFCSPGELIWYEQPAIVTRTWTARPILPQLQGARYASASDLNGDGLPDLVVSAVDIGGSGRGLFWVRNGNNGLGWSGLLDIDPNLPQVEKAMVHDVDRDGSPDVIALSKNDDLILWFENLGNVSFARHVIATVDVPDFFDVANFDGDPASEVVISSSRGIEILDPAANPTEPWTRRPVDAQFGNTPLSRLFAADLDGDGLADIAAASNARQEIRWYRNTSGSAWPFTLIREGYAGLTDIVPADLNGDGRIDLVTSTYNHAATDRIAWWENVAGASPTNEPPVVTPPSSDLLLRTTFDNLAAIQSPSPGLGGTATLASNDFVTGRTNFAASFATGGHVRFPVGDLATGQNINLEKGEVEFWFRPNYSSAGDDQNHVLFLVGDIYSAPRLEITESDRISFQIFDRDFNLFSAQSEYHAPQFQPGVWVHVRAVWDSANATDSMAFYLDGERVGDPVASGWSLGEPENLAGIFIGAGNASGEFGADGLIDELIIRGPAAAAGNQRPTIETIAPRTVLQGEALSFAISAEDPDGGTVTFTLLGNAPAGALIHPQTGVFTWSPDSSTAPGTYPVTVQVADNGTPPLLASATFEITLEQNTAPDVCPSGPTLSGALEGDLGPAPGTSFTEITCLEIRNDQPIDRAEIASAGIPVPRELNLTSTEDLTIIGPGERRLACQFNVISRWGGPVDQADLPIRWLQVATASRVAPGGRSLYSLRRYNQLPTPQDPFAAQLLPTGLIRVSTGVAETILDPSNPALISDISTPGRGTTYYTHRPGAGPKLAFLSQGAEVTLSTATPNQVLVDPGSFEIVENGPVRVVARINGHFSDPQGRSRCTVRGETYERFGYTLIATFERGQPGVLLEFHFRNECSDALFPPWTDETADIRQVSFEVPVLAASNPAIYFAGSAALAQTDAAFVRVEQRKGGGTPWTRRAQVLVGAATSESGQTLRSPLVGVGAASHLVAAQMPWMRYREPQAIEARSNFLSLQFISEPLIVGEGKGIWNFARIGFLPANASLAQLESHREQGRLQLERGLLVRAPLAFVNRAGVFPSLGTGGSSPIKSAYAETINLLHNQTVRDGGQWDRAKTFGTQLWPDVQRDAFAIDNGTPADNNAAMNYWNPSGAELLEFLRTGDPKWVWDFALPQSWLQVYTAYLNIGDRAHGNRNGLAVTSGGTGEGQWHRAAFGSDDYTYNLGLSLAYTLRPSPAFRDRFAQAARTVIDRYSLPKASESQREEFVNQVSITRQTIQHFEMLANAAEFVSSAPGSSAHAKLSEIVAELARDNLRAGVMAEGDRPPVGDLSQPQQFMQTSMMYPFFYRYFRNYGDIDGHLHRALTQGPFILYRDGMEKQPDGRSILVSGGWASRPENSLSGDGTQITAFRRGLDSDGLRDMYNFNKPQTLALLLIAQSLDPSLNLCDLTRQAYDTPAMRDFLESVIINEAGWWKGANQAMQSLIFGVGLYDTCP